MAQSLSEEVALDSPRNVETVKKVANAVRELIGSRVPTIGIVCGSGLGGLANMVEEQDRIVIPYESIAGFPRTGVKGHYGNLVIGTLKLKLEGNATPPTAILMQGRCHPYEGFTFWQSTLPIRVLNDLGVQTVILTNAAGALNHEFTPGKIMMLKDHIYLGAFAGSNPLFGVRDLGLGPRFLSLWNIYDKDFRKEVWRSAAELQLEDALREGVFVMFPGPTFETVAEARALRSLGGDTVAMSTAHEAIVARHCGMKVLAFSVVSNYVKTDYGDDSECSVEDLKSMKLDHSDVLHTVESVVPTLAKLLQHVLPRIC